MSQAGTKSETIGHTAAPSKEHHDFVGLLRQAQANAAFLLEHAPKHNFDHKRGIPHINLIRAAERLQESMMWATTGIYGEAKLPPPDRATLEAAARLSLSAATAAEQIMKEQEIIRAHAGSVPTAGK